MRFITIALALTLMTTPLIAAKGSGGHGGGGHASGGHASGGHAAGGGGRSAGGGHAATGHATPRSSGGGHAAAAGGSPSGARVSGESSGTSGARARSGRAVVGTAVPRSSATPGFIPSRPTVVTPYIVRPYLVRPNFLGFGFGGLGSFYIPYGSWYDDPFYSYYGYPSYSYPYASSLLGGGATTYAPLPFAIDDDEMGKLRLQIDQRLAQVSVDGYYAGIVDEFDGMFQHLDLTPGPHHIQIEQAGYTPLSFDVNIVAHHKTDYRARMAPAVRVQ